MSREAEWFRQQSEYNRSVYERLEADHDDLADWKVTVLFYSALHRVNYWFDTRTGQVPKNHYERNRRVKDELPAVFDDYRDLYLMSMRARYREGFRLGDARRRLAVKPPDHLEKEIPFP